MRCNLPPGPESPPRADTLLPMLLRMISLLACLLIPLGGCSTTHSPSTTPAASQPAMADHFYFRPSPSPRAGWVMLLPGASGLTIFEDSQHYYRAASALNALGYDALIIDYKAAYKAASNPPNCPTGAKIAWVVEQAVQWARSTGKITPQEPGAIIAWSLGAEALWPLLADPARVRDLNLQAAAAYYPSNEDAHALTTSTPLLILTGESDDVTPPDPIREMVSKTASPLVSLHIYPNARHGFDVASIPTPRTVRLLPLVGPSATFGFDADASRAAETELSQFLQLHLH